MSESDLEEYLDSGSDSDMSSGNNETDELTEKMEGLGAS
jgi:hypothetical protein